MEHAMNGVVANGVAGALHENGFHEPTLAELERELPMVYEGQVPLGELVSRMAQTIYAEVTELAETLPNMSDSARKRTLADWVVQTKRQVVKLYAVVKWARDADVVQKAMNVTAFLLDQNKQFEDALHGLKYAKESLDPARLRNHDLLTSLDVLTTGTYKRLPTVIKKLIIPPTPLTDEEVAKTISDVEDVMRYRLRMTDIVPCEMLNYRISEGRAFFVAPMLFEASLCVRGAHKDDGWFFVGVEFSFTVGGDQTGMQEFPRKPSGMLKRHICDEADARLAFYLPLSPDPAIPLGVEVPPRPQLPDGVADAPLVRVFNLLQMMSLSYQLEILWYQAERMRSLGWAEYLKVGMTNNRQTLTMSYWIRKPLPVIPGRPNPQLRYKIPPLGGTVTVSIVRIQPINSKLGRSPKDRVLAELQEKAKLDGKRPSDEVELLRLEVSWAPEKGALGMALPPDAVRLPATELVINPDGLDIDALLRKIIAKHVEAILKTFQMQLQQSPMTRNVFSAPGDVTLVVEGGMHALHVHLCADEVVVVTIDPRTGRLNMRDTGDLAAARRGLRFTAISERLNENPVILAEALVRLRYNTIIDLAEQKANYLGLQSYRSRNWDNNEIHKLGSNARGSLYIKLANFPNHYLVIVITDEDFRYALISVISKPDTMYGSLVMGDIGWVDVRRIHGGDVVLSQHTSDPPNVNAGQKRKRPTQDAGRLGPEQPEHVPRFKLETQVLKELYAYCCARVAYTKVEQQFKIRNIPYTHVRSSGGTLLPELAHIQSSLAPSMPALCVQSSDILSGAPAAEAAMPNVRVLPLNWWSEKQAQVVTCVKLKYVQQPVGKKAGGTGTVIRPSKRIIYDTREAIVSFLSEDVDNCVDEFLEEWARVSKMVVIAREVARMAREKSWWDVRLLSFDLQTVEFVYSSDYTVSITYQPLGGTYELYFSRIMDDDVGVTEEELESHYNPHEDVEPFLRNLLQHGKLASSFHQLVSLLRDTLPIVVELEEIRTSVGKRGASVDIYPKAAGWYRILFGSLRYALDFRLMTGARVAILDGSYSLFLADSSRSQAGAAPQKADDRSVPPLLRPTDRERDHALLLQPIPDFQALVADVVKEVVSGGATGQLVPVNVGVICDASTVRVAGRALYEKVSKRLGLEGP